MFKQLFCLALLFVCYEQVVLAEVEKSPESPQGEIVKDSCALKEHKEYLDRLEKVASEIKALYESKQPSQSEPESAEKTVEGVIENFQSAIINANETILEKQENIVNDKKVDHEASQESASVNSQQAEEDVVKKDANKSSTNKKQKKEGKRNEQSISKKQQTKKDANELNLSEEDSTKSSETTSTEPTSAKKTSNKNNKQRSKRDTKGSKKQKGKKNKSSKSKKTSKSNTNNKK